MKIEKVNGFWVPSNDIHIEQWKSGQPFTQNKCLLKFLDYCNSQSKKFKTVIDIGAWCGTWAKAIEPFAKKVIAFEPDKLHFECLQRNCTINCDPRNEAVGSEIKSISLTEDDFTQAKRVDKQGDIRMITIDSMGYYDIEMIKIDVEGYEHMVLLGSSKIIKNVSYIMIEIQKNDMYLDYSRKKIEKFLRKNNFKLIKKFNFPFMFFQDCIYKNTNLRFKINN